MKTMLPIMIYLLFFFGIPFSSFAGDFIELKTAAQESFPKYYKSDDHKMCGVCIDIIHSIEQADPEIKFTGYNNFLPFKRLQSYLEKGELDVFFGFKKTAKRERQLNFLNIPLYQINYVVAVRAEDNVSIESFDDIRTMGDKGLILTVLGTSANSFLQKQGGLLIDDAARTPSIALKKLLAGRGSFVFYHDLGLKSIINNLKLEKKVKILPISFLTYGHYTAFSKQVPEPIIQRVKNALEKLEKNGTLADIRRKHGLVK